VRGTAGRMIRLCLKELRETLRDRRTVMTLILMPILVYPILSMTLNRFLLGSALSVDADQPESIIGVATDEEAEVMRTLLSQEGSKPPAAVIAASDGPPAIFAVLGPKEWAQYGVPRVDPTKSLEDKWFDVFVEVKLEAPPRIRILALRGDVTSQATQRTLVDRLNYLNQSFVASELASARIAPPAQIQLDVERVGIEQSSSLLASIIPLVLVLMTITGAVYPAIDLTAGERERGTMEALIASPVSRGAVLFAKYIAVVTVALFTAIANLAAMFVTLWASGLMERLMGTDGSFPWLQFVQIFLLLILFSGFFSAVLLTLTSFARSFKEAQAYLIPLMLLSLAPGVLSLMPGIELTSLLAVIPLLNIILLSREILAGSVSSGTMVVVIITTIAYAAAALSIAAKLFGSDAVLRTSEQSIGASLRRPAATRPVPSWSEVATTLALIVPVYFVLSTFLARMAPQSEDVSAITWALVGNGVALVIIFGGLPTFAAWFCRDQFYETFRLRRPSILSSAGAILIGLGMWTWAHEVFLFAQWLGIRGLDAQRIAKVTEAAERLRLVSPWLVLTVFAVAPAVIEEWCFRGYLFSALRARTTAAVTIAATAILFGLFHVVTGNVLLVERFLPTTLLGLALGWVAWHSGSIWPGVLLHLSHNGLLNLVIYYKERLVGWGIGVQENAHLPLAWLAAGCVLVFAGAAGVYAGRSRSEA